MARPEELHPRAMIQVRKSSAWEAEAGESQVQD